MLSPWRLILAPRPTVSQAEVSTTNAYLPL
jgi:hypothetical protein